MSITYDVIDLINNMIELEINGATFYDGQARRQKHPLLAALFKQLAEQEQKHRIVYEHWRDQLVDVPPVDEEYRGYLQEIINEKFHFDVAQAATCTQPEEVIDLGIQLENDSIRFIDAFGRITGPLHRETVEQIRQQEQQHLNGLNRMKATIQAGNAQAPPP